MLECITKYKQVWSTVDESENYHQTHDELIAKEKLRPVVREKIQKEVDQRLLSYLDNIKLKAQQRAAALKAKKKKKGKKGSKKKKSGAAKSEGDGEGKEGDEADAGGAASARSASGKKKSGKKKKGSKKGSKKKKAKKCCDGEKSCVHMPLADMINLLVKMGILQELRRPHKYMRDLLGDIHYLGSDYAAAGIQLDPSMAQLRSVITETCILPLGSNYVKQQAPLVNALCLYGPHGSGKSLLSKAIALETNAAW